MPSIKEITDKANSIKFLAELANYGTVSHGTLNEEHLIRAFVPALTYILTHAENVGGYSTYFERDFLNAIKNNQAGSEENILEFLFDALDKFAPEGYYFCAHVGDGSDFGYWENEE